MGLDQSILGAFGAGVLSFLSPCILPLVAPYLCFLTGADLNRLSDAGPQSPIARTAFTRAFFFVAGFATVFVILGATASTLGQWLSQWFDILAMAAGALIVVMGLHFLGVFRIGILFREARFQTLGRPAGPLGAYAVGLAFAFGWTPCVGPVLAAILLVAGAQDSAGRGVALLGAYSAGIGLPFLAAAAFVHPFLQFLRRFKRHVETVEKAMGVALVITGLLFMTGTMPLIGNYLLETFPSLGTIG
ncbi:MAG: cytochrome c biogenesis CcdA family protein [Beijerinckiaceae bacterium]|nr:cytochrome c biogenesis CcdA family protein [Beijerinckiaceae bacterium]